MTGREIVRSDWGPRVDGTGGRLTDGRLDSRSPTIVGGSPPLRSGGRSVVAQVIDEQFLRSVPAGIPATTIYQWRTSPAGLTVSYNNVLRALQPFDHLDPDEYDQLSNDLRWMPHSIKHAILIELSAGGVGSVRSLPQSTIDRYRATPEGAQFFSHFGGGLNAERRLAIVLNRATRMRGSLDATDRTWFDEWTEAFSVNQAFVSALCLADQ
jgi:hypothetical protein